MERSNRAGPIVVLESNRLVQSRVARILAASAEFTAVRVVEDVIAMSAALEEEPRLLVVPDLEIDLAVHFAEEDPGLVVGVILREVSARTLEILEGSEALKHLISWPDFIAVPRGWDLAVAGRQALGGDRELRAEDLVGGYGSKKEWQLYSSFDRDSVLKELEEFLGDHHVDDRQTEMIMETAYEMAMNAMYDAPVDQSGQVKYGYHRQADIALEDHEVPSLRVISDGVAVVLEVEDPFGRLEREHVIEGIERGLGAKTAENSAEILNTRQGGAGLGVFRMFQLATSLMFDVRKGQHTRVMAVFDLSLRVRDRRRFPASLHLMFR